MIPSARHGYGRALSHGLGVSSLPASTTANTFSSTRTLHIPHAESSAQALQRSIVLQRAQRTFSSKAAAADIKGKAADLRQGKSGAAWREKEGGRGYATAVAVREEYEEKVGEEVWDRALPLRVVPGADGHAVAGKVDVQAQDWPDDPGFPFHRLRSLQPTGDPSVEKLGVELGDLDAHAMGTIRAPAAELNPLQPFPSTSEVETATDRKRFQVRFDKLVKHQSLLAFLSLHSLEQNAWRCLEAEHIDRLLRAVISAYDRHKRLYARMDPRHIDKILRRIRTHLLELAPRQTEKQEYVPGSRFRGRRLADFLSVCVLFRREIMAKGLFVRYLVPQIAAKQCSITDLERYISFLQSQDHWQLIVDSLAHDLYPSHRANLPPRHWSAKVFESVANAYLRLGIPMSAIRLGDEYQAADGEMTIGCFTRLLQARVSLGHHPAAKKLRKQAKDTCGPSAELEFEEKIAILRGQRRMGFDKDLEEAILHDLARYTNAQAGRLVHGLIKLRLGNSDTFGALALLDRFDLDVPDGGAPSGRRLAPVKGTIALAFEIIGRRPNLDQLRPWWDYFLAHPAKIEDQTVATVVHVLAAVGMVDEAFEMVRSHLIRLEPVSRIWRLPSGIDVGMRTVNALTDCMARRKGLDGLKAATDLMRQADIRADEHTLQIILDAVRKNMVAHPDDLAELLQAMLDRASNVKAQIGHIDSILAEAVKLASQQRRNTFLSRNTVRSSGNLRDPAVGLLPLNRFAETVDGILESLRARAVQSSSRSLATRMRFEALVESHSDRVPASQAICNQVLELGYKLDNRHLMALMQGYVDGGEMDQAEQVVQLGVQHGVKTTRRMLLILLRGYIKHHALRRASRVYERILRLNLDSPTGSSDALAVTATTDMIRAQCASRHYHQAAMLVRRDILRDGVALDDRAILVGMTALRWVGQEASSLSLLDKRRSPTLNYRLRSAVRSLHLHLKRKSEQKRASKEEQLALLRAEDVLEADVRSRPYIANGSLFRNKEDDRVPRWYNSGADSRPKLRQGKGAEFVAMIAPRNDAGLPGDHESPANGDAKRRKQLENMDGAVVTGIKVKVERRRMQLENELLRRYERSDEQRGRRGLKQDQKRMVEEEARMFEADLVKDARRATKLKAGAPGGPEPNPGKMAGRKEKGTSTKLPRSVYRNGIHRVRNPNGAVETKIRTEWAKMRRESRTLRPTASPRRSEKLSERKAEVSEPK
jgi:hypothetical protein